MVGPTQHHVPCTCTHGRCYASHGIGVGWGWGWVRFLALATHGRCYATSCSLHLHKHRCWCYVKSWAWGGVWGGDDQRLPSSKDCNIHGTVKNRDSKKQSQKDWLWDMAIFLNDQRSLCALAQWILTLPPKILWPTALLNTWNIITFPKSSFYHTNHTFLTNINVWMMDFWSINTRIKKISSAQITILCREWLLQKLTFRHSEITIFNHSQYPTQRTFGEPPAPSVYIYIYTCITWFTHIQCFSKFPTCAAQERYIQHQRGLFVPRNVPVAYVGDPGRI